MKKVYKREVSASLKRTSLIKPRLIVDRDLCHLPPVVRRYLEYAGVVGKEEIVNVRIKFEGRLRSKTEDSWMTFKSEQYNFYDNPTRIFFIKASKMGIPVYGIHLYKDKTAIMIIKLAGLFKIVDAKGAEMNQGETVTVFNDMCCMAPAT
jgi:hypothetical protein